MARDGVIIGSAWGRAIDLGDVRAARSTAGAASSVCAIADSSGTSPGRAGDLLKIRDAFRDEDVDCVGVFPGRDAEAHEPVDTVGHRRLSQLSFRALRQVSSLPRRQRFSEVWRRTVLSASSHDTEGADAV